MAVDAEGRKPLLGMRRQDAGEIDGAGTLGAVKAPDGLDGVPVHVHGFRTVAPAGGDGQGNGDAFAAELFLTGGSFSHPADGGVRNDDLYRLAVGIAQVFLKQPGGGTGHVHGLVLQAFPHLQGAPAAVNRRPDADHGIAAQVSVFYHCSLTSLRFA